jgi:hypothetical protein
MDVCVIEAGDAAGAIARAGRTELADFIAMSRHGLSGFKRIVLGGVAEKVVPEATYRCSSSLLTSLHGTRRATVGQICIKTGGVLARAGKDGIAQLAVIPDVVPDVAQVGSWWSSP